MTSSTSSDPVLKDLRTRIALASAEYCTAINEREFLRVNAPGSDEEDEVRQHHAELIREASAQVDQKLNDMLVLQRQHEEYVNGH